MIVDQASFSLSLSLSLSPTLFIFLSFLLKLALTCELRRQNFASQSWGDHQKFELRRRPSFNWINFFGVGGREENRKKTRQCCYYQKLQICNVPKVKRQILTCLPVDFTSAQTFNAELSPFKRIFAFCQRDEQKSYSGNPVSAAVNNSEISFFFFRAIFSFWKRRITRPKSRKRYSHDLAGESSSRGKKERKKTEVPEWDP
jgi:hypothetical protein